MTNLEPLDAAEWQKVGEANEIARMLSLFRSHVEEVLTGKRRCCAAFGGSGMGKNYLLNKALEQFGSRGVDCGSACKKDPVSGVIGVQKGPLISMV